MKKIVLIISLVISFNACIKKELSVKFVKYDEKLEIEEQQEHNLDRMKFKLIQSKYLDMNDVFKPFEKDLQNFSSSDYYNLAPYIIEKNIPSIQESVKNGILTYEKITLFYLYRIRKFESDNALALNSIISLNRNIINEAREKDLNKKDVNNNSLYGLPILLKDNINTLEMPTTAGAFILKDNIITNDAFIVNKLKEQGALILGKANLSEWAYFFCSGCPLGYSAIGGQTLNPYGRKKFETGGSSSGSGVSVAANFSVAAIGTETAGSILSPASKNNIVGLKPTIGLLSRSGIVPISSTLDTPGPMAKNVIDTAILLDAMIGPDDRDSSTLIDISKDDYLEGIYNASFKGKRIGVIKDLLEDPLYKKSVQRINESGAEIIKIVPPEIPLEGFVTLLNIDMKNDLPNYLKNYADKDIKISSIKDIIKFNHLDSLKRAPYGQQLFNGIVSDSTTLAEFDIIKQNLIKNGISFFNIPITEHNLDAVLSINNYHAAYAAVAKYPCLAVPMGFEENGEPKSLTFIAKPFQEKKLIHMGYAFEQIVKARKAPDSYK